MTYKKMIESMVDRETEKYVHKQTGDDFQMVDIDSVEVFTDTDSISFVSNVTVYNGIIPHSYRISGYISEWGNFNICSVSYARTINEKYTSFLVYDDELKTFKFDK